MPPKKAPSTPRGVISADPTAPIVHRSLFKANKAFLNGVAFSIIVPVAGGARWRARIKTATGGGTLSAAYVRNVTGNAAYTSNNPANVAVVAGTENIMEEDTHMGESLLKLTFTPSADGTLTYLDFMGV